MNSDYLPLIILAVLVPLIFSPITATAIDITDEKFKVIVTFEMAGNPNVIRGLYQTTVDPQIDDAFDAFGENYFDKTGEGQQNNPFGYSSAHHSTLFHTFGSNPMGDNQFQIYPLVRVTGDKPDLSEEDYAMGANTVLALMRIAIIDFLQEEGAYNVSTYIHFTFGTLNFDEGF